MIWKKKRKKRGGRTVVKWIGRCDYKCFSIFLHLQKRKQTKKPVFLLRHLSFYCVQSCFKVWECLGEEGCSFQAWRPWFHIAFLERRHPKQVYLVPLTFDCHHLKHLVGFPKSVPMKCAFSHYLGALITKPNHQVQPVSASVWQKPRVKRSVSWKVIQGSCHGICSLPDLLTGSHIDSQVPWASPPCWLFTALFSPDSFSLGRTA